MTAERPADLRLGFISPLREPFVLEDLAFLQRHFTTLPVVGGGLFVALRTLAVALRAELLFCWSGSTYAALATLIARIRRRPVIIQLAGADTVADSVLGYGIWRTAWKRPLLRWMLRKATRVLVVHRSLIDRLRVFVNVERIAWAELPTGYDPGIWQPDPKRARQGVLTVARCPSLLRLQVKGIDRLLQAAARLPEVPFTVVGINPGLLERAGWAVPPNVTLLPPLDRSRLLVLYQSSRVYCQPSRYEGLPNTLAEAMLCGCLPVVTRTGGMPDLVKEVGWAVPVNDAAALIDALQQALAADAEQGHKARAVIQNGYSRTRRDEALLALIAGACSIKNGVRHTENQTSEV